ncbi:GNAT family N-acetyltransferase [Thermodesulfobacteriota bacterium]
MDKNSINIREAEFNEASALAGIISESFRDVAQRFQLTPGNCPKHPSNCKGHWVEKDFERGVSYFILEHIGENIGCVALEKADTDQFYLERLSVLPEYRQRGYGKALVDYIFLKAKKMGAERMGIGIISKHAELKMWYQKMGFVEVETKEFPHLPFVVSFMEYKL